ncbi:hypothetical protein M408DRAFT_331551 [Serendipita vermifera MAFF 305830]|uniref:UBX domain-containing protein n=1 Tax=Serendipita vermifera MAFF 305830 TaxID=933852 RepID=A0A0C3AY23_SERVB|nr:hypothetical protein M408DRAFT_331551 [Serendipita vermifera MAFF 305830]
MEALTDAERATLSQLQAIMNDQGDVDTQISLLQSVDWDLQAATQMIYGDERPPAPRVPTTRRDEEEARPLMEPMEIDDTLVFGTQPPRTATYAFPGGRNAGPGRVGGLGLFSLLMAPFSITLNILSSLLHFVFRVLRIPFPRLRLGAGSAGSSYRSGRRGSYSDDPAVVAERWVRELEEETGAMCISKAALIDAQGNGNGVAGESEAGPSSGSGLVRRHAAKTKTLPDFFLGGYDAALKAAQRDAKVLCVILTSEEHDDVPAFRRDVLTDPEFVRVLTDNQMLVWGGDVRERDGYQAALKLGVTTYPFVAFMSLYARRDGPDALTVITRHSGPPTSITSASALCGHITGTVLPRVAPVLNRKRAEQRSREYERKLREDQDRAYAESQVKDYERIVKHRAEEQRKREEEQARRLEAQRREELAQAAAAERQRREDQKMAWRRYARRMLVREEIPGSTTAVSIKIRMPSGKQLVRRFERTDTVTSLYAFVASQFIPEGELPEDDPLEPPGGGEFGKNVEDHDWDWEFQLAVAFPKSVIGWTKGDRKTIGDVGVLKGGGNLVVEMQRPIETGASTVLTDEDDDETASEDSE